MDTIYIEEGVASTPAVSKLLSRFEKARHVPIHHYGEIFNRRNQNFQIQKKQQTLILAEKNGRKVHPTPAGFEIGKGKGFYFSHMLNCLFDCRYCFLQGMYPSASMVLFVNFEEFQKEIEETIKAHPGERCFFFSGYDSDSLATEPWTGFADTFIDFFAGYPEATLELRTKSIQTRALLSRDPIPNCVVAYTLTPDLLSRKYEHGAPTVAKRIEAIQKLQQHGWSIGLRFDPLLSCESFSTLYQELFQEVFAAIDASLVHSATMGPFRLPKPFFSRMEQLYPREPLFCGGLEEHEGMISYPQDREKELTAAAREELLRYIDEGRLFCQT